MYGLLLKNLQLYIEQNYGAKKWKEIKDAMKLEQVGLSQIFKKFSNRFPKYFRMTLGLTILILKVKL